MYSNSVAHTDCSGVWPWIILIFRPSEVAAKPRLCLCQGRWNSLWFLSTKQYNLKSKTCEKPLEAALFFRVGLNRQKDKQFCYSLALVSSQAVRAKFALSMMGQEMSRVTPNKRVYPLMNTIVFSANIIMKYIVCQFDIVAWELYKWKEKWRFLLKGARMWSALDIYSM